MSTEDNVVYVGSKPPISYVHAVVTQFNEGQDTVKVKARGKAIATAVDVAEMVRNRFEEDADVADVAIGTDRIEDDDGPVDLSAIRIDLER